MAGLLADCHVHFEGTLPEEALQRLAARAGHAFANLEVFRERCRGMGDGAGFLSLYADVCRLFRRPEDYGEAAREMARCLASDGVGYAEVHVSPEICSRVGLDPHACLEAIEEGFRAGADDCTCRIVLDTVRHWGPEAAERVLDLHEKKPLPAVVGFGMGGEETSYPAAAFGGVYARARALGLKTTVHAGEWAGPESVTEALDALRPDRVDHGIAAAANPRLLERLADELTILCVAPTGNVATGAAKSFEEHPLPRLVEAGVRVALSADDPLFFATTTAGEYRTAREQFGLGELRLRRLAENSWRAAFCPPAERDAGIKALKTWRLPELKRKT